MDLSDIKLILAVASVGSFSKEATLNGISQSAASNGIFQLELTLGQRLFSRYGRGASLTQAGQLLVQHAQTLARDVEQLPQLLRRALAEPGGLVRMPVQTSISWALVRYLHPRLQK